MAVKLTDEQFAALVQASNQQPQTQHAAPAASRAARLFNVLFYALASVALIALIVAIAGTLISVAPVDDTATSAPLATAVVRVPAPPPAAQQPVYAPVAAPQPPAAVQPPAPQPTSAPPTPLPEGVHVEMSVDQGGIAWGASLGNGNAASPTATPQSVPTLTHEELDASDASEEAMMLRNACQGLTQTQCDVLGAQAQNNINIALMETPQP